MILPILMYSFFVVLYIKDIFVLSLVGQRQLTNDNSQETDHFTRGKKKDGQKDATCNMGKGGSGHNKNTGNQNVNFGKRQVTNDFTRGDNNNNNGGDNNKRAQKGVATCTMGKGGSGRNKNTGNQNVSFGK